jgi:hypothetical protein
MILLQLLAFLVYVPLHAYVFSISKLPELSVFGMQVRNKLHARSN